MKKVGMIVAVEEEVPQVLKRHEYEIVNGFRKYTFNDEITLILSVSLPKRNNAEIATKKLLSNFDIDYILNIGCSGGAYKNSKVGDFIIADSVRYKKEKIILDLSLINKAEKVMSAKDYSYKIAPIEIFDNFVFSKVKVNNCTHAVDQESFQIAKTSLVFNKKTLIVRCISDILTDKDPVFKTNFQIRLKLFRGFKNACKKLDDFFINFFNI